MFVAVDGSIDIDPAQHNQCKVQQNGYPVQIQEYVVLTLHLVIITSILMGIHKGHPDTSFLLYPFTLSFILLISLPRQMHGRNQVSAKHTGFQRFSLGAIESFRYFSIIKLAIGAA